MRYLTNKQIDIELWLKPLKETVSL
jgi:hypothetical protein